jgi:hypothetical protein
MAVIHYLPSPISCDRCMASNVTWTVYAAGPHLKACCPACGAYIKFLGKAELRETADTPAPKPKGVWRDEPATDRQCGLLRSRGYDPEGMTKGQASDLISEIMQAQDRDAPPAAPFVDVPVPTTNPWRRSDA